MDTNFFAFAASRLAHGDLAPALLAVCAADQARTTHTFQPTDEESAACHALAAQLAACLGDHPEFCCEVLAAEGETWADLAGHCRAPERLLRALNHATHGVADRSPVGGETLRAVRGEFAASLDIASHTLRITHSGHCAAEFPCAVGLDFPADCESFSIRGKRIDAIHYDPAKVSAPERELPFTRYRLDCDGGICLHATPTWDATLFSKGVGLSREHAAILYAVTATGHTFCLASHAPAESEAPAATECVRCAEPGCEKSGCEGECTHEECDDPHCLSANDASCESAAAAENECSATCEATTESTALASETAACETACDESSVCGAGCETTEQSPANETLGSTEDEGGAEAGESIASETATCEATASCGATEPCTSDEPATHELAVCDAAACETPACEAAPATSAPACETAEESPAAASDEQSTEEASAEVHAAAPQAEQAEQFDAAAAKPAARRVTAWLENYLQTRAGKKEANAAAVPAATSAPSQAPSAAANSTLATASSVSPVAAAPAPAPIAPPAPAPAPAAAAAATPASRDENGVFWTAPNGWQVMNLILSIAAMVTLGYVVGRQTAPPQTVHVPSPPPSVSLYPSFQPGQPVIVPAQVPNTPVSPANYAEAQRPQPQPPAPQPLEPAPRADLKMDVYVPEGQVAVGDDAQYEIHLTNRGRIAAEEIDVQAFFSEGFEPVAAEGSLARINPGRVEFARIARIVPGQEVVLKVVARSAGEGERIFRPEVKCRNPEDFLHAEVATRFFFAPPGGGVRR